VYWFFADAIIDKLHACSKHRIYDAVKTYRATIVKSNKFANAKFASAYGRRDEILVAILLWILYCCRQQQK